MTRSFISFSNILSVGGGPTDLSHMFHPLDADLSAITQQMVDMELIHGMPSTSSNKGQRMPTTAAFTLDDRLAKKVVPVDNSATSGNITPSSPGSDLDINTNEATRGGSTFEMVKRKAYLCFYF